MILIYFKQAWNLLRQEKLFSSIHVAGTGLSISIVMVLSIVYYIKTANIYPETNRDRILIVKNAMEIREGGNWSSPISLKFVDEMLRSLDKVETMSVTERYWSGKEFYIQIPGSREQIEVIAKFVDVPFWTVFPFRFIEGKPFTDADFESGISTAVISESTAKRTFGRTDVVGDFMSLNFKQYRICGVVKDASYVTSWTYANVWLPYTLSSDTQLSEGKSGYLGNVEAILMASSPGDLESIRKEILTRIDQYNRSIEDFELTLLGQPDRHWQSNFRFWSNIGPDFNKIAWQYGLVFLVLLLVPAISLSGMTDSRMERRLAEMGVRRAFGAPVNNLMGQIISENFLFTILGGLAGLLFSYIMILLSADWIMSIGANFVDLPPEGTKVLFTPGMLINIPVFLIALLVCFVLNMLTALIPAWRASHREIIFSLNAKQ